MTDDFAMCGNCRYSADLNVLTRLECRRNAPAASSKIDSHGLTAVWPAVSRTDVCGQHERKPAKAGPSTTIARPVPLFPRTCRDPFGMGDGCQAWFDVRQ